MPLLKPPFTLGFPLQTQEQARKARTTFNVTKNEETKPGKKKQRKQNNTQESTAQKLSF